MAVRLVQHRAHKVWRTVWNSVVVMASRLLTGGNARCVSLHRGLVEARRSWVFVAGGKNPRRSGPWVEWVSHCLAILSWVEETVSFTGAGRRRQKLAARRVLFLPRSLATEMAGGRLLRSGLQEMLDWLEWQMLAPLRVIPEGEALVYCLSAGRSEYIGFTAARTESGKKTVHETLWTDAQILGAFCGDS